VFVEGGELDGRDEGVSVVGVGVVEVVGVVVGVGGGEGVGVAGAVAARVFAALVGAYSGKDTGELVFEGVFVVVGGGAAAARGELRVVVEAGGFL
jgi:hypothetical protein